jgi:hypothetical protein
MSTVINKNDVIDVKIKDEKFNCLICDFKCFKLGDWSRHLLTAKHQKSTNINKIDVIDVIDVIVVIVEKKYICNCGKEYLERTGLWRHKKICSYKEEEQSIVLYEGEYIPANNAMILQVLKDNKDMMGDIMGLVAKTLAATTINNTIINNNNTTNNKQFNLNIYLHETCKDAMNMEDFIKDIRITNKDMDDMGSLGFSLTVSNIIVRELGKIDETKRPFHCTDKKRELFCIKEKGEWIKDTAENKIMKCLVGKIANFQLRYILEWKKANPGWDNPVHKKHDEYRMITKNLMEGIVPEVEKDHLAIQKTLRNIIKYCLITKK